MSLEFRQVGHRYARRIAGAAPVLDGVTLAARAGRITCLLGPSGSGKSTLLRLAAGLERLQAGSIRLDGEVLAEPGREPPPERRPVGVVFQDHALFPHRTVRQNIAFGLKTLPAAQRDAAVAAQLDAMGLAELADRYPDTLSGGQQQRVALARALAPMPRVLLLDEPFASVDATLRRTLRADARRALRDAGAIAMLVTHDPEEALEMADRIAVLDAGHIVQDADPADIWRAPAERTVAELFGQAQRIAGTVGADGVATRFGVLPKALGAQLPPGTPVDVVARPSAIALRPDAAGGRIVDARFLGDRHVLAVEAGGETLRASVAQRDGLAIGDRVAARFLAHGTFVYTRPA